MHTGSTADHRQIHGRVVLLAYHHGPLGIDVGGRAVHVHLPVVDSCYLGKYYIDGGWSNDTMNSFGEHRSSII